MIIWLAIIIGAVVLDQVTKILAVTFLDPDSPFVLIDGVFSFTYVENEGAAFGMLSDHRWIFMVISCVAIIAMLIYLWKFRPQSKWACVAISFIIGGGIGNMIDRVRLGYVIDFLDFNALGEEIWPWVFNVADAFVCVGGAILLVWCVVSLIVELSAEKKAKAVSAAGETAEKVEGGESAEKTENSENSEKTESNDGEQK